MIEGMISHIPKTQTAIANDSEIYEIVSKLRQVADEMQIQLMAYKDKYPDRDYTSQEERLKTLYWCCDGFRSLFGDSKIYRIELANMYECMTKLILEKKTLEEELEKLKNTLEGLK